MNDVDVDPEVDAPARRSSALLALGLVALIAAMTFTFLAFTRDDGAATAEEATRSMIDALQAGDAIGALDLLPPGERLALRDSALDLSSQLQRLGLLTTIDPQHIEGASIRFDDVGWITTELEKDVRGVDLVNGTLTVQLAPGAAPPLTDRSREMLERAGFEIDQQARTMTRNLTKEPLRMVAIREGGGWHVSLAYTTAEWLRSQAGVALPPMGKGPSAIGADSPSGAVLDLFEAYAGGDPERVLTLMYPDEARVAYDYAPAFLPAAKERAAAADRDKTFDVQVNRLEVEAAGAGPVRTVKVKQLDLDVRDEIKKSHVTYDGRCLHTDLRIGDDDPPYRSSDTCDGDWGMEDAKARVRDNPVANLAVFGGGADLPTFVIIERNGRWFISPVRTLVDSLVDTLERVPADKVDVLADRIIASWRAGGGSGISGQPIVGVAEGEDPTDVDQRQAQAGALVEACRHVTEGPGVELVVAQCQQRLLDGQRIIVEDLDAAERERVLPPPP